RCSAKWAYGLTQCADDSPRARPASREHPTRRATGNATARPVAWPEPRDPCEGRRDRSVAAFVFRGVQGHGAASQLVELADSQRMEAALSQRRSAESPRASFWRSVARTRGRHVCVERARPDDGIDDLWQP